MHLLSDSNRPPLTNQIRPDCSLCTNLWGGECLLEAADSELGPLPQYRLDYVINERAKTAELVTFVTPVQR